MENAQQLLTSEQISEFHHSFFVDQQVDHFRRLAGNDFVGERHVVVDVGGGCGHFALALQSQLKLPVRVIDSDPVSVNMSQAAGVEAICEDALEVHMRGDEAVACFNLILHHLIGGSEARTRYLQAHAMKNWQVSGVKVFVNEYIYESWFGDLSASLIYKVTKSNLLSSVGKFVSRFIPSLRANTFGVGVRFRSRDEWRKMFESNGFRIIGEIKGENEVVSLPRRLLMIKAIRRDSFLLAPS